MSSIRKVAIVGGLRTPFARSMGAYMGKSNQDLLTASVQGLVEKFNLKNETLGEVALGSVITHSKDWNLSREVVLGTDLSANTPAYNVQQACGTSLETCMLVANKIALGHIDCGIAGGSDTNSDLPFVYSQKFSHKMLKVFKARTTMDKLKAFSKFKFKDLKPLSPGVTEPRTGLSMGQSCELMAKEWNLTQQEQDQLAFDSHNKAIKAYDEGFFDDLLVPFNGLAKDNNVRKSSLEKLASLKPAFDKKSGQGTLTAGNSTPLTDGASAVLLCSEEWAKSKNLPILAYLTFSQTAAVDFRDNKEGLLMAPAYAVSQMLIRAGLSLQDFDFYEIHEAFAAQALCTMKAWESEEFCKERLGLDKALGSIDKEKLNVKGGSVAVGHPFGATGGRIVSGLAKLLDQKGSGRGLISICTGGGMGVTAILEK